MGVLLSSWNTCIMPQVLASGCPRQGEPMRCDRRPHVGRGNARHLRLDVAPWAAGSRCARARRYVRRHVRDSAPRPGARTDTPLGSGDPDAVSPTSEAGVDAGGPLAPTNRGSSQNCDRREPGRDKPVVSCVRQNATKERTMSLRRYQRQERLFPALEEAFGPLASATSRSSVGFLPSAWGRRAALARAVRHHHHPCAARAACHRRDARAAGTGSERGDLLARLRRCRPPARGADRAHPPRCALIGHLSATRRRSRGARSRRRSHRSRPSRSASADDRARASSARPRSLAVWSVSRR